METLNRETCMVGDDWQLPRSWYASQLYHVFLSILQFYEKPKHKETN